jgi:twitching motility protein PilI
MASSLNLRQYQESILARLDNALHDDAVRHKTFLGIGVGAIRMLVDMQQVSEVLPVPDVYPAPNSRQWFLGTTNVRGNLYAMSDFAAFLRELGMDIGANPESKKNELRMLLLQAEVAANTSLLIDRLIGLRSLENFKLVAKAGKKKKPIETHWQLCFSDDEYEDEDGNLWKILDCKALVNLKDFMQAGLA